MNRWWNTWLQILMSHYGLRFMCSFFFVYSCYKSSMQCELSHIAPVFSFLLLGSMSKPSFLILLSHLMMTISSSQSRTSYYWPSLPLQWTSSHPALTSQHAILYWIILQRFLNNGMGPKIGCWPKAVLEKLTTPKSNLGVSSKYRQIMPSLKLPRVLSRSDF